MFLDERHRRYSQPVFAHDVDALADAMRRKLELAFESIVTRRD